MNVHTRRTTIAGPAGVIECAIDEPGQASARGVAVLCHPHPQHGGALQNKVVQTLARAFVQLGWRAVRFNFRGVGGSEGQWDEGRGEVDDAMAVIAAHRDTALPLALGGFSFGGYVATQAAARLPEGQKALRLVLIAPAARNFPLADVPQDTIVIHGEADDVVPLSAVLDWARPQVQPVIVVPTAGHFFHGQLPLLRQLVVGAWH
ncbi:MAG: alpha/beta fold hydrolase [Burkholderiales bacterium]|nr:alpha/beta fold hydrolase [Burkholderiales bacterium]